jgi:DNA-directed RNA polymerase specialized sigma24 family protein
MTSVQLADDELLALIEAVKPVARARGLDVATSDDIAQETITRLLAVGERLEPEARLPYALTTAGNLIISLHRSTATAKKYQPRLVSGSGTRLWR